MGLLVCTYSIRNYGMMQLIFLIQYDSSYLIMYLVAATFYSNVCVSHSCPIEITMALYYRLWVFVVVT